MMKTRYIGIMLAGMAAGLAGAQMPTGGGGGGAPALPTSFDASGSAAKPASNDPSRMGERPNPQLLGMELPLLDPASDTVSYNGGQFDVGNNAAVRSKFETYLHQIPDDSAAFKRYRALINEMLNITKGKGGGKGVGNSMLSKVGQGLSEADTFPGDKGQAGVLREAMAIALTANRANARREQENASLTEARERRAREADILNNANEFRKRRINSGAGGGKGSAGDLNKYRIADKLTQAAEVTTRMNANAAENKLTAAASKVNFQATLVGLLLSRYFDHVRIGSRVYRQIFNDGDSRVKLEKNSKANELFSGGAGLPPTVNSLDSLATTARNMVDAHMQAVHAMLAQNRLGEATQHLIEAVAIGENMESVCTFSLENRRRVARYWTLRKRALTALNARDYDMVEEVARQMKEMDEDFDDSMLRSFTNGKRSQSNLALRNAAKALKAGNEEDFNRYISEAAIIWPNNPKLAEGEKTIARYDEGDDVKDEFRRMFAAGEFRRIAKDEKRYEIVAMDPELAAQYKETLTLVMKMDGIIEQLKSAAEQDEKLGPCAAYEKMLELQKEDERYAADEKMRLALHEFESHAHEFVDSLRAAEQSEARREFGSALSSYYRAQGFYPQSKIAKEAMRRIMEIIVNAQYD